MTSENLRRAADLQDQIVELQTEINQLLNGEVTAPVSSTPRVVKTASGRRFTPEAIAKISAAQKRRWKIARKQKAAAAAALAAPAPAAVAPAAPVAAPAPAPAPAAPAPAPAAPAPAPAAQPKKGQLVPA